MAKAIWNGAVPAEAGADAVRIVEGNVYFPPESVDHGDLRESKTETFCHRKGSASYYHVVVDGKVNSDAAWFYVAPKPEAAHIAGHVAFWKGVQVDAKARARLTAAARRSPRSPARRRYTS